MSTILCPCGTTKNYADCCGRYIDAGELAPTPEALMRARYTAFATSNIAFVEKTMHGKARQDFNLEAATLWAKTAQWLGLRILNAPKPSDTEGFVEFIADCQEEGQTYHAHERSRFEKINSVWYYIDGDSISEPTEPEPHVHSDQCRHGHHHHHHAPVERKVKVGRNDPCLCGSGKKFKKCCGVV